MSKKDRERARRTGKVFRSGELVPKKVVEEVKPREPEKGTSFDELRKRLRR